MSTLQTLKDPSGEVIYPSTHEQAVLIERGENDVITLEDYRGEVANTFNTCAKKLYLTAKVFDPNESYTRDMLVWYEDELYLFLHSKSPGPWDSSSTTVRKINDLMEVFQTQMLRDPLSIGSFLQGNLEAALDSLNETSKSHTTSINSINTSIGTLNNSVSDLNTNKQNKLTTGNGININSSNEISTDNMPSTDMSEIVTPLPGIMSRRMKYSTDEQIVGEWIDGKPLYQKIFNISGISNTTGLFPNTLISNLKRCINIFGTVRWAPAGYDVDLIIPNTYGSQYVVFVRYERASAQSAGGIEYYIADYSPSDLSDFYITIQYTKTTD